MRETVARVPIKWPAGNCSNASHRANRRFTVSTRISATVAPSRMKRTSHGRTFGITRHPFPRACKRQKSNKTPPIPCRRRKRNREKTRNPMKSEHEGNRTVRASPKRNPAFGEESCFDGLRVQFDMATADALPAFEPCGLIQTDGSVRLGCWPNAGATDRNRPSHNRHFSHVMPAASERHSTVPSGFVGETWKTRKPAAMAARKELAVSVDAMKKRPYSAARGFSRQS